jgi:hypothetical protein
LLILHFFGSADRCAQLLPHVSQVPLAQIIEAIGSRFGRFGLGEVLTLKR